MDTSGKLPTGESFVDIAELKRLLLKQKDQFSHCLTEKMLTYALGREVGFQDRPAIESIVGELAAKGYGLHDLVELIVTSEVFIYNEGKRGIGFQPGIGNSSTGWKPIPQNHF